MFQVIIDTNVLLAGLRSKRGASYHLLLLAANDHRWQINLSVPLLLEYEAVLKRPDAGINLSHGEIDKALDFLCTIANRREIFYLWRPALRDPKDDFILELAVESVCDFIITFNVRDFAGVEKFGLNVITPSEFLQKLGEIK
jgi:putative PIN family toxin of toxin-antitoxin system